MKRKNQKSVLAGIVFLFVSSSLFADIDEHIYCTRHINNKSNSPWVFRFNGGDIHVDSCNNHGAFGTACVVAPHATATLAYYGATYISTPNGNVQIIDELKRERSFSYHSGLFESCVVISHNGKTGSVSLNEPANGDFVIERDRW